LYPEPLAYLNLLKDSHQSQIRSAKPLLIKLQNIYVIAVLTLETLAVICCRSISNYLEFPTILLLRRNYPNVFSSKIISFRTPSTPLRISACIQSTNPQKFSKSSTCICYMKSSVKLLFSSFFLLLKIKVV